MKKLRLRGTALAPGDKEDESPGLCLCVPWDRMASPGGACYPTARKKVTPVLAQGSVSLPEPPVHGSAPFLQDGSLLPHLLLYQGDIPGLAGSL